ncbi:MAG: tRNA pseudouridine(55) synthase TruB [Desulfococcaceae bacterium]
MTNGLLLMDKPAGMSSARLVSCIKKLSGAKKAGHAGTLDPFATGLMICCLNRATKLSGFFLHGGKSYEAVLCLGTETDTQDCTGNITGSYDCPDFSAEQLENVFSSFSGTIQQTPPVYSALKHQGVPLYRLARKGQVVEKPAREVHISEISIMEIRLPEIRFRVSCSGGTYIRTLASDIGRMLGCGAHLRALRRTACGDFSMEKALTLPAAEELSLSGRLHERIISMNDALPRMPSYTADAVLEQRIMHGKPLNCKHIPFPESAKGEENLKVLNTNGDLLALLNCKKEENRYNYSCVFISNMDNKENRVIQ